jgi:hypothetical protein
MAHQRFELRALRLFGEEAERLELPRIAAGGFIVPGRDSTLYSWPGKEKPINGKRTEDGQEAGSTAGTWERPSSQATAPGAPAYALRALTVADILEELRDYGSRPAVVRVSSRFAYIRLAVGLFRDLSFGADLLLEIPVVPRRELRRGLPALTSAVPDVRAWATWKRGGPRELVIRSHHQYPDLAICACMPAQWILGRHPLIRYVDFCVVWIAKALHDRELHFYPGLQHYGEKIRLERDRVSEYCGCGRARRYGECHRPSDIAMGPLLRAQRHHAAKQYYLEELATQGREAEPPHFAAD